MAYNASGNMRSNCTIRSYLYLTPPSVLLRAHQLCMYLPVKGDEGSKLLKAALSVSRVPPILCVYIMFIYVYLCYYSHVGIQVHEMLQSPNVPQMSALTLASI